MRIIKATESIPVEHPVFMIFGQPGICKSSLGYSAKDPLVLDFDKGAHRAANRRDTLAIDTWADVQELMTDAAVLAPYGSVVVDTVGRCLDVMTVAIIAENMKMGRDGNLTMQGWGVLKGRFRTWVSQLRALGKDVILIAHDKEDKDGDTRVVRPEISGGSYGEVMKVADFVGYVYMNGKDRVLDFNPTDRWIGKNPAGWKAFAVPPVEKATTVLADLFDKGRAALGSISEGSSKIAQAVDDWRSAIASYTTLEECNRAIDEIKKLATVAQPQVKKLLMERATFLKFTYDPNVKGFVELVAA